MFCGILPWHLTCKARKILGIILYVLNTALAILSIFILFTAFYIKYNIFGEFGMSIAQSINLSIQISVATAFITFIIHFVGAKMTLDLSRIRTQTRKLWIAMKYPWLALLYIAITLNLISSFLIIWQRNHIGKAIEKDMKNAMNQYTSDVKKKAFVDILQMSQQCCGSESFEDWFSIPWINEKYADENWDVEDGLTDSVPFSCCNPSSFGACIHHLLTQPARHNIRPDVGMSIYTTGCGHYLTQHLKRLLLYLFITCLVATILEIVVLVLASYLFTAISSLRNCNSPSDNAIGHLLLCSCLCNEQGVTSLSSYRDTVSPPSSRCSGGLSTEPFQEETYSNRGSNSPLCSNLTTPSEENSPEEYSPGSSPGSRYFSRLRSGGLKARVSQSYQRPPLRPVLPRWNFATNLSPMF